jgi:hypothetical protein
MPLVVGQFGNSVNPIPTRGSRLCPPHSPYKWPKYSRVPNRRTGRLLENEKKTPPIRTYLELYVY